VVSALGDEAEDDKQVGSAHAVGEADDDVGEEKRDVRADTTSTNAVELEDARDDNDDGDARGANEDEEEELGEDEKDEVESVHRLACVDGMAFGGGRIG
jgi:hypothetical protein